MARFMDTRKWIVAGSGLALVLAAACGSSGDGDGGSTEAYRSAGYDGAPPAVLSDEFDKSGGLNDLSADAVQAAREDPGHAFQSDATSGVAAPGSGADGAALPSLLDRQIIRTATVAIEAENVARQFEQVGNIAAGAGGFVASSSFGNSGEQQTASVTVRVPGSQYQSVLVELRRLGEVTQEQSSANDVTEEYTDLQSRLRNLQATEQRYLDLLSRANTIDEILTVQDRINGTRFEIEQVLGRIQLLDNQTELATVTVHLSPPIAQKVEAGGDGRPDPQKVAEDAFEASLAVLLGMATVGVAVAAFSWWLAPVLIAMAYIARRQIRSHERDAQAPPAAPMA